MIKSTRSSCRGHTLRISGVNPRKCMKCGKCSGTCPAYDADGHIIPTSLWPWCEKGEIETLMQIRSRIYHVPFLLCLRGALPARRGARAS